MSFNSNQLVSTPKSLAFLASSQLEDSKETLLDHLVKLHPRVEYQGVVVSVPAETSAVLSALSDGTLKFWEASPALGLGRLVESEGIFQAYSRRLRRLQSLDAFLRQAVKAWREEDALRGAVFAGGALGESIRQATLFLRLARREAQAKRERAADSYRILLAEADAHEQQALDKIVPLKDYFAKVSEPLEALAPEAYLDLVIKEAAGEISSEEFSLESRALKNHVLQTWVVDNYPPTRVEEVVKAVSDGVVSSATSSPKGVGRSSD